MLKRGITDNNSLFEWLAKCSGEGFEKEHQTITKRTGDDSLLDAKKDVGAQLEVPGRHAGALDRAVLRRDRERARPGGAGGEPRWLQQLIGWYAGPAGCGSG